VDILFRNENKAGRRQNAAEMYSKSRYILRLRKSELGATVMDAAFDSFPESLEDFFEKAWVRSLFVAGGGGLARILGWRRELKERFNLFEAYDLEAEKIFRPASFEEKWNFLDRRDHALAWARREFPQNRAGAAAELCCRGKNFRASARRLWLWTRN